MHVKQHLNASPEITESTYMEGKVLLKKAHMENGGVFHN